MVSKLKDRDLNYNALEESLKATLLSDCPMIKLTVEVFEAVTSQLSKFIGKDWLVSL